MLTQILAVLGALPDLIKLLNNFFGFMQKSFGDDWSKYIADTGEAFRMLNESKTAEDKQEAAKKLAELAKRWGRVN